MALIVIGRVVLNITFSFAIVAVAIAGCGAVLVALAEEREHHWQEDEPVEEAEDHGEKHNLERKVEFITET